MLQSEVFTITDKQLEYIIYIFYYVLELILYSSKNGATLTSQLLNRRRCNATSPVTLHNNHYFTLTLKRCQWRKVLKSGPLALKPWSFTNLRHPHPYLLQNLFAPTIKCTQKTGENSCMCQKKGPIDYSINKNNVF